MGYFRTVSYGARSLAELRNLLGIWNSSRVAHTILNIEFNSHRIISHALVIDTPTFDAGLIRHDLELCIQARSTVCTQGDQSDSESKLRRKLTSTEKVDVLLARVTNCGIALRGPLCNRKACSCDHNVRGVCCTTPLLS
jgi:hypothetical protein